MTGPSIVICPEKEKLAGLGEDSFSYSFVGQEAGYISVFDGCGGMGARKYPKAGNKTGARVASKLALCYRQVLRERRFPVRRYRLRPSETEPH